MGITDTKQSQVVQRLFDLVPDIGIVERTLLRFERESEADPTFATLSGEQQLKRLLQLLLEERKATEQDARGATTLA
jgi:hypothetical protein